MRWLADGSAATVAAALRVVAPELDGSPIHVPRYRTVEHRPSGSTTWLPVHRVRHLP